MGKKRVLFVSAVIFALGVGGCVSKGTYVKKAGEADNLAKELAAQQQRYKDLSAESEKRKVEVGKLSGDVANLESQLKTVAAERDDQSKTIADLQQRVAALESENAKLLSQQKAQEEKVQKVSKTYEDLLAKMKSEIAKGQITISELKGKLTVNMVEAILFDTGRAKIKKEGLEVLQKVVSILTDVKDKAIRIEGHTDNVPIGPELAKTYPTNWDLSAARAINVTRYLQEKGLDPSVLSAVGYGEYKPIADNGTPEGKAKNRRIEIILVPKE